MSKFYHKIILFVLYLSAQTAFAQNSAVYGIVTDAQTGEIITEANIFVPSLQEGTVTNEHGFYSLTLPNGNYVIVCSAINYVEDTIKMNITDKSRVNIKLDKMGIMLKGVDITANKNENVNRIETSVNRLSANTIKNIPAMMGEVDVIKALQFLPGVQQVAEGSSNFSVRGGGYDQNLILLDGAPVYSSSHLLGFFSIFNNDAIKDVQLYKGDIPASFGGRLSSLMDVRTRDGNNQRFSGTGGIGTISSRLTLESPIFTDKVSFLVSGRRTYADLFLKLTKDANLRATTLYFYDLNAKLNWKISENDRLSLSGYLGKDHFANTLAGMAFGNKTGTLQWNHIFSSKLISNLTFLISNYDYSLQEDIMAEMKFIWNSNLRDLGGKLDFIYMPNSKNTLKFGYQATIRQIRPGEGGGEGENNFLSKFKLPELYSLEHAVYLSHQITIKKKLNIRYGLRFSMFNNFCNDTIFTLKNYQITDTSLYKKNKIYNTYLQLEPRISINYSIDKYSSVKASYSRSAQYLQIASNSTAGSPLDVWFSASNNVKPQICDQVVLGYFRNIFDGKVEISAEAYYKHYTNVIDFMEKATLFANRTIDLERQIRVGTGYSWGLEFMIAKPQGKLNGWISYTYSRSFRKIDEVNNNLWFKSPYDKPSNITIVANYDISPKWTVSASWLYATGMPVTYPEGRYWIGSSTDGKWVPIPSERNAYRFPDFHRLDISATWKISKPGKRFQNELNISIYNVYARKNPWTIYFIQDKENPNVMKANMIYLFSIVPSISWNFKF